eukprot:g8493.t1
MLHPCKTCLVVDGVPEHLQDSEMAQVASALGLAKIGRVDKIRFPCLQAFLEEVSGPPGTGGGVLHAGAPGGASAPLSSLRGDRGRMEERMAGMDESPPNNSPSSAAAKLNILTASSQYDTTKRTAAHKINAGDHDCGTKQLTTTESPRRGVVARVVFTANDESTRLFRGSDLLGGSVVAVLAQYAVKSECFMVLYNETDVYDLTHTPLKNSKQTSVLELDKPAPVLTDFYPPVTTNMLQMQPWLVERNSDLSNKITTTRERQLAALQQHLGCFSRRESVLRQVAAAKRALEVRYTVLQQRLTFQKGVAQKPPTMRTREERAEAQLRIEHGKRMAFLRRYVVFLVPKKLHDHTFPVYGLPLKELPAADSVIPPNKRPLALIFGSVRLHKVVQFSGPADTRGGIVSTQDQAVPAEGQGEVNDDLHSTSHDLQLENDTTGQPKRKVTIVRAAAAEINEAQSQLQRAAMRSGKGKAGKNNYKALLQLGRSKAGPTTASSAGGAAKGLDGGIFGGAVRFGSSGEAQSNCSQPEGQHVNPPPGTTSEEEDIHTGPCVTDRNVSEMLADRGTRLLPLPRLWWSLCGLRSTSSDHGGCLRITITQCQLHNKKPPMKSCDFFLNPAMGWNCERASEKGDFIEYVCSHTLAPTVKPIVEKAQKMKNAKLAVVVCRQELQRPLQVKRRLGRHVTKKKTFLEWKDPQDPQDVEKRKRASSAPGRREIFDASKHEVKLRLDECSSTTAAASASRPTTGAQHEVAVDHQPQENRMVIDSDFVRAQHPVIQEVLLRQLRLLGAEVAVGCNQTEVERGIQHYNPEFLVDEERQRKLLDREKTLSNSRLLVTNDKNDNDPGTSEVNNTSKGQQIMQLHPEDFGSVALAAADSMCSIARLEHLTPVPPSAFAYDMSCGYSSWSRRNAMQIFQLPHYTDIVRFWRAGISLPGLDDPAEVGGQEDLGIAGIPRKQLLGFINFLRDRDHLTHDRIRLVKVSSTARHSVWGQTEDLSSWALAKESMLKDAGTSAGPEFGRTADGFRDLVAFEKRYEGNDEDDGEGRGAQEGHLPEESTTADVGVVATATAEDERDKDEHEEGFESCGEEETLAVHPTKATATSAATPEQGKENRGEVVDHVETATTNAALPHESTAEECADTSVTLLQVLKRKPKGLRTRPGAVSDEQDDVLEEIVIPSCFLRRIPKDFYRHEDAILYQSTMERGYCMGGREQDGESNSNKPRSSETRPRRRGTSTSNYKRVDLPAPLELEDVYALETDDEFEGRCRWRGGGGGGGAGGSSSCGRESGYSLGTTCMPMDPQDQDDAISTPSRRSFGGSTEEQEQEGRECKVRTSRCLSVNSTTSAKSGVSVASVRSTTSAPPVCHEAESGNLVLSTPRAAPDALTKKSNCNRYRSSYAIVELQGSPDLYFLQGFFSSHVVSYAQSTSSRSVILHMLKLGNTPDALRSRLEENADDLNRLGITPFPIVCLVAFLDSFRIASEYFFEKYRCGGPSSSCESRSTAEGGVVDGVMDEDLQDLHGEVERGGDLAAPPTKLDVYVLGQFIVPFFRFRNEMVYHSPYGITSLGKCRVLSR